MNEMSHKDIRYLRKKLGWSVDEFARVLNKTTATIYNWERGKTRPGGNTSVLLRAIEREYEHRCASQSGQKVERWTNRMKKEGLTTFLRDLAKRPGFQQKVYAKLARKAQTEGVFLLTSSKDHPLAYIVPMTRPGLLRFYCQLLTEDDTTDSLGRIIEYLVDNIQIKTDTCIDTDATEDYSISD